MMQEALTEKIIGYFYKVYNTLGFGFLEKVYESALGHELRKAGLLVESQTNIKVFYDGITIGDYFADIIVEGKVIVELKIVENLDEGSFSVDRNAQMEGRFMSMLLAPKARKS